jgi:hypothetical protein
MSLLGMKRQHRPFIVLIGLAGAALIYGDGAITPAISVLSALEGLEIVSPGMRSYILPLTVIILIALFFFQYQGTDRIGKLFGPIMLIYRKSGDYHRHIFNDAAGDPTRMASASAHYPNVGHGLRTDLRSCRELASDGGDSSARREL